MVAPQRACAWRSPASSRRCLPSCAGRSRGTKAKRWPSNVRFTIDTNIDVFFCDPRCQGLCGSQKKTSMLVSIVNRTLLGHLFALVPRERPAQLGRHLRELAGERHARTEER